MIYHFSAKISFQVKKSNFISISLLSFEQTRLCGYCQYDQMLKLKLPPVFLKVAQIVASPVWLKKRRFSQLPKKSPNKIYCQQISKIAQSGHTGIRFPDSISVSFIRGRRGVVAGWQQSCITIYSICLPCCQVFLT